MLPLDQITLIGINGTPAAENTLRALLYSSFGPIRFRQVLLLCPDRPNAELGHVTHVPIPALTLAGYQEFRLRRAFEYFDTDWALFVEEDGFVIRPDLWEDEFLRYDYIGAPWRTGTHMVFTEHTSRVGNSGFCLQSRRFCQATSEIVRFPDVVGCNCDVVMCMDYYPDLTKMGFRYAPIPVAARFSLEYSVAEIADGGFGSTFGFHGKHFADRYEPLLAGCSGKAWPVAQAIDARRDQ